MVLTDLHNRRIKYLRLSVTDRCNLRCRYCMPEEGVRKLEHNQILTFEQMHRIARLAISLGIEKIRITGGEPLVRKNLVSFLQNLARIEGLKELVLTTNGLLLRELAPELRRAGVHRLNISLDSLKPGTFATITRGGDLGKALDGISAAEQAGFPPLKINAVVIRGMNDDEVVNFAALTIRNPHQVRFIEYMPTRLAPEWASAFVSGDEILNRISKVYPLQPLPSAESAGPAKIFRIPGAMGTIGVIAPISRHFCASCNRVRLTASGTFKGCLFDNGGIDLKPYLDRGDDELRTVLMQAMQSKPDRHHLLDRQPLVTPFAMSEIGG
jgi:cyclic pyranopterin phosphate synthase